MVVVVVVIVIVPVLLIAPATLVLVPPFVIVVPASLAGFVQFVPRMLGCGTIRPMMLNCLVQVMVCVLDAMPTLLFFVICMRPRHSGKA
jgi:hypothetical protein